MFNMKTITSEFVSYGHPDKIADLISDSILDSLLRQDPNTRAGIETLIKDNIVVLGGEIKTTANINYDETVRNVFNTVVFPKEHKLSPQDIKVINLLGKQSPEINKGVEKEDGVIGAGDQGMMYGFASNETDVYLPLGYYLAKKICQYVASQQPTCPDAKAQVTVEYDDEGKAIVKHILVSTMHLNKLEVLRKEITQAISENYINIPQTLFDKYLRGGGYEVLVNPCGEWRTGGSVADCGVTGRKIVVDAYGGYCNVGGGAYSGKDASKVDRSAAYLARYIAKNIVAAGISNTAKVELSYAISVPQPTAINIELDVNKDKQEKITNWIKDNLDLTPNGIIKLFNGSYPRYFYTTLTGCYGQEVNGNEELEVLYPWEKTDLVDRLREI